MTFLRMFILDLPVEQPCIMNGLKYTVLRPLVEVWGVCVVTRLA